MLSVRPTGRGGWVGGWVFWKFWVGGCPKTPLPHGGRGTLFGAWVLMGSRQGCTPPPLCNSYALVQATAGMETVSIWYSI